MIKGIDIKNYRGFGHDTQKIPNLSKINIFIGRNNCGKSNILRFIEKIIINTPFIHPKLQNKGFEQLDYFDGNTGNSIEFSVTLDDESIKSEKVIKSFGFGEIFLFLQSPRWP